MQNTTTIPENAGILDLSVAFIEAMLQKGRRTETLRAYSRDLAAFLGFVGDVRPSEVTSADVELFLEQLASEGKAIASVIRARDVVRAFWSWMRSEGRAAGNPADDLVREATAQEGGRFARAERRRGPAPDDKTVREIINHLWNPEDRLAATLIAASGLAASEILSLRASQVMFVNDKHPEAPTGIAVLRLPAPRGGERMVVVAEPDVVRELKRQTRSRSSEAPLCSVAMRTLQHRFHQAAADAGFSDITLRDLKQAGSQHSLFPGKR